MEQKSRPVLESLWTLGNDALSHLFEFLSLPSMHTLAVTCVTGNKLASQSCWWRNRCLERSWRGVPCRDYNWKAAYWGMMKWTRKLVQTASLSFDSRIVSTSYCDRSKMLAVGTFNYDLFFYDAKTRQPTRTGRNLRCTARLHNACIDNQVVIYSPLGTDCDSAVVERLPSAAWHTLKGHTDEVGPTCLHQDEAITGSDDGTVKLWAAETGKCIQTFRLEVKRAFRCVRKHDSLLLTGNHTGTIWDVRLRPVPLHTLDLQQCWDVHASGYDVAFANKRGVRRLDLRNMKSGTDYGTCMVGGVRIKNDITIAANDRGVIEVWRGTALEAGQEHDAGNVCSFDSSEERLFIGGTNKKVCIYEPQ